MLAIYIILAVLVIAVIILSAKVAGLNGKLTMYEVGALLPKHDQMMRGLEQKITALECLLKEKTTWKIETIGGMNVNTARAFDRILDIEERHRLLCKYLNVKIDITPARKEYVKIKGQKGK